MNVTRAALTDYVDRTAQALRGRTGLSDFAQQATAERLEQVASFASHLQATPGNDLEQILQTSQERGGSPGRRAMLIGGAVLGVVAAGTAGFLALLGAPLVAAVPAMALGAAVTVACTRAVNKLFAEDDFQNTLRAFGEDAEKGVPPGIKAGWRASASGGVPDSDSDWLINPANPASPLSPLNPGNPASPLSPFRF
ncbi:MAG: hypothetical protein AB1758_20185 [Candidatus Eremiobacterota bacterium]